MHSLKREEINLPQPAEAKEEPYSHAVLGPLLRPTLRLIRRTIMAYFEREIRQRLITIERNHAYLEKRFNLLEQVIAEHPANAARGFMETAFPSPAVSVIMPVYNREVLVIDAIRSVQAQSFRDWELIIIDDGSTDGTQKSIAAFLSDTRIRYFRQENAGPCRARNAALAQAKGALVAYLDSDNIWYPDFLNAAVMAMAGDPALPCLYGAMVTESHVPGERILFRPFDREKLLENNFIGMSTFVHRRSLVEKLGAFDEDLKCVEDWDLILRYTQETPALPLPVRAVRYRNADPQRLSLHVDFPACMAKVYAKWGK